MRQRKPVDMKAFSVAHNLFMFCASLYMVIETVRQVGGAYACLPIKLQQADLGFRRHAMAYNGIWMLARRRLRTWAG